MILRSQRERERGARSLSTERGLREEGRDTIIAARLEEELGKIYIFIERERES